MDFVLEALHEGSEPIAIASRWVSGWIDDKASSTFGAVFHQDHFVTSRNGLKVREGKFKWIVNVIFLGLA
eukprot:1560454-Amphidinium_carterae.1